MSEAIEPSMEQVDTKPSHDGSSKHDELAFVPSSPAVTGVADNPDSGISVAFSKDEMGIKELQGLLEQFDPLSTAKSGGKSLEDEQSKDDIKSESRQANDSPKHFNDEIDNAHKHDGESNSLGKDIQESPDHGTTTGSKVDDVSESEDSSPVVGEGAQETEKTGLEDSSEVTDSDQLPPHPIKRFSSQKSITQIPKNQNEDRPFDFQRFLDQLRHKSADPIACYVKSFLSEFGKRPWTVSEQVKIITDFKEFIYAKMALCPPFNTLSEHEMVNATEGMEKLIMNRLYSKTFSPVIDPAIRSSSHEEDVIRDSVLGEKMRIWSWIEGRHLDIGEQFLRNGEAFVKLASDELLKINHYRAPRDKVICILNCCKVIFGLLRQTHSEESADGFLPILIFVVIKAQPKNLISNANYIERFRNPDMMSGEAGYYLNSLIGAVSFIEQLDRSQLSITDEEFEQNVEESIKNIVEPQKKEEDSRLKTHPGIKNVSLSNETPPVTPERQSSPDSRSAPESSSATDDINTAGSGMNASQVLYSSAGLFTAPFRSLSKLFESDPADAEAGADLTNSKSNRSPDGGVLLPEELAARQVSAEEHEARRISQKEFESVADTLKQMFPILDRDIIEDVLRGQDGRVGAAVDACLTLVG